MRKEDLLRLMAAVLLPHTGQDGRWDLDAAIRYAQAIYQRTAPEREGDSRSSDPRKTEDWLSKMSPQQAQAFGRFWTAYGLKSGKQRAARRWLEIAPDPALAARITAAAEADRRSERPEGQARKWPEGWLSDRRWEDHAPLPGSAGAPGVDIAEMRRLSADLRHAMGEAEGGGPNAEYWQKEVQKIRAKIDKARSTQQ